MVNPSSHVQFSLSEILKWSRQRSTLLLVTGLGAIGVLLVGTPFVKAQLVSSSDVNVTDVNSNQAEANPQERVLPVETLAIEAVSGYDVSRTYTGAIASLRASELGFERSGQLVEVLVEEGDIINAGTPLARLDIRNLQTQRQQLLAEKARANAQLMELEAGPRSEDIAAAEATVRDLEQQLGLEQARRTRRESLYAEGAISREELDEFSFGAGSVEARLDQARSQLLELKNGTRVEQVLAQQALVQQLDARIADLDVTIAKSTLNAPFDGIVSTRQVDEGTVVGAGQSVLRLLENAIPEARVGMPVDVVNQLKVGDQKTVYLSNENHSAVVTSILPEVDVQTRTQTVVLALQSSATAQVSAGQTVRVAVDESIPTEGMWVPTVALTQGIRGLWTCYVVVPQETTDSTTDEVAYTVQPQSVEILHQEGDRVLVRGTLQPNDMIVASGTHRLVAGQRVRPVASISQN